MVFTAILVVRPCMRVKKRAESSRSSVGRTAKPATSKRTHETPTRGLCRTSHEHSGFVPSFGGEHGASRKLIPEP
jgi:hypothetical protein